MALADSVPGVSGGTVAFLLGFYDKFIMSLDYLMSGTKEERIEAIKFLIRILQRRERFVKRKIPEYHLGSDWSCTCCSNHIL